MGLFDKARERFDAWNEARKERKALKEQQAIADNHLGHGRFFLLTVPATATILAAFVEVYWAILFCIEATGRVQGNVDMSVASTTPLALAWDFAFSGNIPVLLGLLAATAPIVMISMVWLPVQFAMRGYGRWRRGTLIAVGLLANAIVIISGTVVMNHNRQDQVRADLVVEQTAQQGRAALEAQRASIVERRDALIDPSNNTLQAQAARAGVAGWDAYIETARRQAQEGAITPNRLALIERARGSAVAVEDYQRRIDELTGQIAAAPTQAAVAANVEDTVGAELNGFAQQVEVWRPPVVAVACTLIGILGAWWTLAMMLHMNPRDVLRSGWAPEELRIPDMRDQPSVTPEPMEAAREAIYDAETGEELVHRKATWAKRPKRKGKPEKVEIKPEIPLDETGVRTDGGSRIAVGADGLGGVMESPPATEVIVNLAPDHQEQGDDQAEKEHVEQNDVFDAKPYDGGGSDGESDQRNAGIESGAQIQDEPSEEELAQTYRDAGYIDDEPTRDPETREDRLLPGVAAE